ncbi:MAG: hypothetical protein US48_C0008G0014 [Candidatus Levybacteria bacterium GW2011_GWA2_37_36]|nr:MAG: hypothetical protein US48_C0008G0014 [Candidatus Levybacteria bacterium GW2011_GWA2_37_36]
MENTIAIEPMPTRGVGMSRVVGTTPENEKELLGQLKEIFDNPTKTHPYLKGFRVELSQLERQKTPEEEEMIRSILTKMPDFIRHYGGTPVDIKTDHIHILDKSRMSEEMKRDVEKDGKGGLWSPLTQNIMIFDMGTPIENAESIIHEILHFNSFQSFQLNKGRLFERRSGFTVASIKKLGTTFFRTINEETIRRLSKKFSGELFGTATIIPDKNEATSESVFYELTERIHELNKVKFNSEEDVFSIFARATVTGKLLPVARLVNTTFKDKEKFRRLGEGLGLWSVL